MTWFLVIFSGVMPVSDEIAIRVRGLGKRYTIGGPQEKYHTFRDAIVNSVKAPFRKLSGKGADQSNNEFWALKDVSFDVKKGEVIGIIGRNGAGKSTLLKILSRITTPTEGEIEIFGRVGSLLEVGTGFHPELTGRENVFLSGSILGMQRRETEEKFDAIVTFAEIERFIDTPVKRYSSGMYVRLAFAVAAHLEPEILLVDEVLAVGDAAFQKKCLGKMGDVAKEGRTVLFVSHNMTAILSLCRQSILLEEGRVQRFSSTADAVQQYLDSIQPKDRTFASFKDKHPSTDASGIISAVGLRTGDQNGPYTSIVNTGDHLVFEIHCNCGKTPIDFIALGINSNLGQRILTVATNQDPHFDQQITGNTIVECHIPDNPLAKGEYSVTIMVGNRIHGFKNLSGYVDNALSFRTELKDYFKTGIEYVNFQGYFVQKSTWIVRPNGPNPAVRG